MDLGIDRGVTLPADSAAAVVIQTLLGKETVSLQAGRADGILHDGSSIPSSRTTTPVSITQLGDISVRLLNRSDAEAFDTFLQQVTYVTEGKGDQVRQIVSGLGDLVGAVDARRTQLGQLLTALRQVSTTLGERDGTIVSLIDHLDPVLADLAARQRDIQTLLVATDSASHATADLVVRNRAVLDGALAALHQDLTLVDQHQVDIAAAVSYLDQSVKGYQSVGYSQGVPNHWANIFVQSLGPAGVDALLGQCGFVDQLIDDVLGTDCRKAGKGGPPGGAAGDLGGLGGLGGRGRGAGRGGGGDIPPIPLPIPTPTLGPGTAPGIDGTNAGLPDSVADFLDWIVGTPQGGGRR
jgi:phospholipid/cholesterol/gamma-HCH transport system substrate-binding protein